MPAANHFRHQEYRAAPPAAPWELLVPDPGKGVAGPPCEMVRSDRPEAGTSPASFPPVGSNEFAARMQRVGQAYRDAGVAAIVLVHGTFVGSDPVGLLAELSRVFPAAGAVLQRTGKRLVDQVTGDGGNFTHDYAQLFETAINAPGRPHIPVRLFPWSGQNNHIGRADAAVQLIDKILETPRADRQRVLMWGHSHAGNVFALVTNLLAADQETRDRFFDAARVYYRWPLIGSVDVPRWPRVRRRLDQPPGPQRDVPPDGVGESLLATALPSRETPSAREASREIVVHPLLDIVTFGTPIRYGWDTAGYARLLHFVFHRPAEGLPDYQAPFPPSGSQLLDAANGDYVQQLGIAGTNLVPSPLAWRSWLADARLHRLLQPNLPDRDLLKRLRNGARIPDEGTTLLVDYGPDEEEMAGHAVYTRSRWLLLHAEEVARRFYGTSADALARQFPPSE